MWLGETTAMTMKDLDLLGPKGWSGTPAQRRAGGYDNCGPVWPYENGWAGVSVEDQATADERIPVTRERARWRGLSAEPVVGHVDIACWRFGHISGSPAGVFGAW